MDENINFQSYCWSLGTTSFRVKDLNFKIEKQLQMLNRLWLENPDSSWNGNNSIQEKYYEIMQEEGFISGNASNKAKDAREKTSGLVQIGVIDKSRKVTPIGEMIIDIVQNAKFDDDNIFGINKDSFVYLQQLLKMQISDNGIEIKPFIVLLYFLTELNYLTKEEFKYILPLCTTKKDIKDLLDKIKQLRNNEISLEDVFLSKMNDMTSYSLAICFIQRNGITSLEDFNKISFNRKGPRYDKPLFDFMNNLYSIVNDDFDEDSFKIISDFIKYMSNHNSKVASYWKKYLRYSSRVNYEDYIVEINQIPIFDCKDRNSFEIEFFKVMHLAKWTANLEDYADLNKRYISLSDIVLFDDDKIELDTLPRYYFADIAKSLINEPLLSGNNYYDYLYNNIEFKEIYSSLNADIDVIIKTIQVDNPNRKVDRSNIRTFIQDDRLRRFNQLIDKKFSDNSLIELLNHIEINDRHFVDEYMDWNADIPTIFEYLLGISWYKISERKGNILEFMKLSLDANLLPKTHAGGGIADIVYEYDECNDYPKHDLLIEATISESTGQRHMEMEPVSRHLGENINRTNNMKDYVVFIANRLEERLILDFRNMKSRFYPLRDGGYINGLKIIPLDVKLVQKILKEKKNYKYLYSFFENAYSSTTPDPEWFTKEISNNL